MGHAQTSGPPALTSLLVVSHPIMRRRLIAARAWRALTWQVPSLYSKLKTQQ